MNKSSFGCESRGVWMLDGQQQLSANRAKNIHSKIVCLWQGPTESAMLENAGGLTIGFVGVIWNDNKGVSIT